MMNYILFDSSACHSLLPFTHTRPVADIRCGIFTLRERWEFLLRQPTSTATSEILQAIYPISNTADNVYINGAVVASAILLEAINKLSFNQKLVCGELLIAFKTDSSISWEDIETSTATYENVFFESALQTIEHIWDIFSLNDSILRSDFQLLTLGRASQPLSDNIIVVGKEQVFLEAGATIHAGCIINASTGPVYLAKDAEILEGSIVRGPLAMGEHAVIKMGAKIYGATTIGEGCKVGGEISNVVFFANSNKGHDGYLGNAVIGEWCNLGADTNCSNLKNNYDTIKIWDEYANRSIQTGLQFCGLMMGDHSKCGINTMFNTGTVVGVSCNIYGAGFPRNFIPSFSWGSANGFMEYQLNKAIETASKVFARRNMEFDEVEQNLLRHVFEQTQVQRNYSS